MDEPDGVVSGHLLSFEPAAGSGLEIVDHVERRRCWIDTDGPVLPRETSGEAFMFPVDRGVSITTSRLSLLHTVGVYVRNHAGWMVDELSKGESRDFPEDRYSIDFSAPIKLYANFESEFRIEVTADDVSLVFEEPTEVCLGARSHHERPAETITTTTEPEDVMTAVSNLGSALKTTTCERSYPTLRGHPPTIELGDDLHVPPVLERPQTGVRIEIPRTLRHAFVVSSLAYYLGAEVVPGETPRIVTDDGFTHALDDPARGFEGEVERVLKQSFFLDCVTRTEGYYPVDLHERNAIEPHVDLDFAALYDAPLSEQLDAYLDVPYEVVEPHVPQWKLTAHVEIEPEHLEALPFVVNDLAVVTPPDTRPVSRSEASERGLEGFMRARGPATARAGMPGGTEGDFTRSAGRGEQSPPATPDLIEVQETDALEQTWIGEGVPLNASKAMIEAFRNRLDREPTDGDIDITVICNDGEMDGEGDMVDEVYGSREDLPFEVNVHRQLSTDELGPVLREETDFLHYIGHIDAGGFECPDGMFDAGELDDTGVNAFLLNACTSYEQGMHLIKAGAIAGVVTFDEVINSGAERIGETLSRLLNSGFPLKPALAIARKRSIMGGYYLVIGQGGQDIAQPKSGSPSSCKVSRIDDSKFSLEFFTYPIQYAGVGSFTIPFVSENEEYYLVSGHTGTFELTQEELDDFLAKEVIPVRLNKGLQWSDEITVENIHGP